MTDKNFTVAGIISQGATKVRFTNDLVRRVKQFSKGGASRIDLVDLPNAMTKVEALKYLQSHADFQSPADQVLISDSLADRSKAPKEVKVKTSKASKPTMSSIKAKATAKKAEVTETTVATKTTSV
jgi:hypothetical protein